MCVHASASPRRSIAPGAFSLAAPGVCRSAAAPVGDGMRLEGFAALPVGAIRAVAAVAPSVRNGGV